MAAAMARALLAALALLSLATPAAAVEVCKVVDLQLVTQTGEFFLAGTGTIWSSADRFLVRLSSSSSSNNKQYDSQSI